MYSVLILTKNEEINLPECLASIPLGIDIYLLDSFSDDRTCDIAEAHGVNVYFRKFDNYAAQRNYGLNEIQYHTEWVLMLDADERISIPLHDEIISTLSNLKQNTCLFRFRRKDFFMGRWLRRSSGYPTWFGRLARRGRVIVQREINEEFLTDGDIGYLNEHLIHFPFNKGVAYWFERHNKYSTMEAKALSEEAAVPIDLLGLCHRDPIIRRKWMKQLIYRVPGRPLLIFLYLWLFRGGIFDGKAGLNFCILRSIYECMIDIKIAEASLYDK